MPAPVPTPLFHITPITNLNRIALSGELYSKHELVLRGLNPANISYDHIQARRAARAVPLAPGGTLHDYVPFHFAPRSPMLDAVNRGKVPNCLHRQQDIVHVVCQAQNVAAAGFPLVFTDFHAVLEWAHFFGDLNDLDQINWPLFFEPPLVGGYCKYYFSDETRPKYANRSESRQAEFLVHRSVPIGQILRIGVYDANAQTRAAEQLAGTDWNPNIDVVRGWYF